MPSGRDRAKVDSTFRKSNGNSSLKKSKVVNPRNPKLVRTKVEDDKVIVNLSVFDLSKPKIIQTLRTF